MYWPSVRSRWLDIGRVLFFFFFSFLRFYGLWQVKVQKNAKKRNDANIQLSWPYEQYEFDIIRIKKWLVYFQKRERNRSVEKDFCSSCHERGTEKKFWVPMRNRTSEIRIPRSDALPLSHRESTVSERFITKFVWHASYILLGSAMSIVYCL